MSLTVKEAQFAVRYLGRLPGDLADTVTLELGLEQAYIMLDHIAAEHTNRDGEVVAADPEVREIIESITAKVSHP